MERERTLKTGDSVMEDGPASDRHKVLAVEDDERIQNIYARELSGTFVLIQAFTSKEGLESFERHPDVRAIIMDGWIITEGRDTLGLIVSIRRKGYTGLMLATSNMELLRRQQVDVGCSHACDKEKVGLLIKKLLTDKP